MRMRIMRRENNKERKEQLTSRSILYHLLNVEGTHGLKCTGLYSLLRFSQVLQTDQIVRHSTNG